MIILFIFSFVVCYVASFSVYYALLVDEPKQKAHAILYIAILSIIPAFFLSGLTTLIGAVIQ